MMINYSVSVRESVRQCIDVLPVLRLRGYRGPAHHGVLRGDVRALAARHTAHLSTQELRSWGPTHTY